MMLSKKFVKSFLKLIFTMLSLTGLFYQTSLLIGDYLSGKTVVSVTVGMTQFDSLPAVTICTDKFFSVYYPGTIQFKEETRKLWQEYYFLASLPVLSNPY